MARRIPSDRVASGRHAERTMLRDDKYVNCWNCGFKCQTERDRNTSIGARDGEVKTYTEDSYILNPTYWGNEYWESEVWGGGGTWQYYADDVVGDGCPLCGCLIYDKR